MKFFAALLAAAQAQTDAADRMAVIQDNIANLTAPMPTVNSGSRFTAKFVNRLAKLTEEMVNNTNAWGTACDEGSGAGSGDGAQGDDIFAFNTGDAPEDKCQLNKQINRALNSYVRNYVCSGRGNYVSRTIRRLRKVKNWYNTKYDCAI
ncbi:Oidioi.mRNA.OKI2018_I69.chr2.g4454.t1.cds [Oikopleura dioica]|uniref:Oidioi.mRNA.OKI2018_I69.chr2.g4454.t1.cds n=1 Tax=Oikopleura dioica TaxID=34765 RepID=A0ABN7T401_OIKDI|nr:Oidioi.mRNA.OKI2018_I69.chr2.g4454.t1.cds [Oikopleura dioica]